MQKHMSYPAPLWDSVNRTWSPPRHWRHNTAYSRIGNNSVTYHIISDGHIISYHIISYQNRRTWHSILHNPCTCIPAPSHRGTANNAVEYAWQHILARAQCGKHWGIHEWSSEKLNAIKYHVYFQRLNEAYRVTSQNNEIGRNHSK